MFRRFYDVHKLSVFGVEHYDKIHSWINAPDGSIIKHYLLYDPDDKENAKNKEMWEVFGTVVWSSDQYGTFKGKHLNRMPKYNNEKVLMLRLKCNGVRICTNSDCQFVVPGDTNARTKKKLKEDLASEANVCKCSLSDKLFYYEDVSCPAKIAFYVVMVHQNLYGIVKTFNEHTHSTPTFTKQHRDKLRQ